MLELDLHQAQRAEPEGLDKNHQEGDHSHGDAHLHGFLGGVAAGVLTLANQDGQVMEGQDVVEVDSGENDQCNGNRRYAGSLNKGEERRDADAQAGHNGTHEHVDDHGQSADEQREEVRVRRNGAGKHDVCNPGVHAGGATDGTDCHSSSQEHEGLDVNRAPGRGSQDLTDDRHGHKDTDNQGDPSKIVARNSKPQGDCDDEPHDGADLFLGKLAESGLLSENILAVIYKLLGRLEESKGEHDGAQGCINHGDAHVDEPVNEADGSTAVGTIGGNKRVEGGVAGHEEHGAERRVYKQL